MNTRALFDLTGRVALVTGGNGGIGRGIAIGLAEAGAAVAVFGRNDNKNARVLDELKAIGSPSLAMNVDVTDRDGLEPAFQRVERELGEVDILVNNAGHVNLSGGVLLETAADWDRVIESQLNAVFLLSKLVAAAMAARRRGKIVNVGSMYWYFGSGLIPSYSAAKGAVIQLTKSMAIELAPHNVQVNAIAPGWIETDMTAPVRTPAMIAMNDRDSGADPGGPVGTAGRDCRNRCVPGLARVGLRHRRDHSRGRWLFDQVRALPSPDRPECASATGDRPGLDTSPTGSDTAWNASSTQSRPPASKSARRWRSMPPPRMPCAP